MVAACSAAAAAIASLAFLALGVAAFTGEAEALLLLAADPSLFFLGDLICEGRIEVRRCYVLYCIDSISMITLKFTTWRSYSYLANFSQSTTDKI